MLSRQQLNDNIGNYFVNKTQSTRNRKENREKGEIKMEKLEINLNNETRKKGKAGKIVIFTSTSFHFNKKFSHAISPSRLSKFSQKETEIKFFSEGEN